MIVIVTAPARADTNDAADAYDLRQAGLGDRFLDAVDKTLERIGFMPRASGRVNRCPRGREVRESLVHRFPFRLVYEICSGEAHVLSVTPARSVRQTWRRRLP